MDRTNHLQSTRPTTVHDGPRSRAARVVVAASIGALALLLSGLALPAAAQENETPTGAETTVPAQATDTSTSSEPVSETTTPAETSPESTAPEATAPLTETTAPLTETTSTSDTMTTSTELRDGEDADPMSNEAPGEEAPGTDVTVPPKTTYNGQEPFKPAEILWSSVAAAERKLDEAVASKQTAIVHVRNLRKRYKELKTAKESLAVETAAAIDKVAVTEDRLSKRAVLGYRRFGSGSDSGAVPEVSDQKGILDARRRSKMVGSALDADESDLDELAALRAALSSDARQILDRKRLVIDIIDAAESDIADIDHEIDQAAIEYQAFKAGSEIFIHGVMFPIAGTYSTPLIDSYGFPRMPGTPDEHWHEGIDLFAAKGAPLVATERGVITKLGVGRLGGLKFWLKGESGTEWYYAHLDSFAPGLADGVVVEAGQLVGYVGNTGNALTTPPHLHMQVHPGGGEPVNPYPLLKVVSDLELAAIAAGTHPGYEHAPKVVSP